MRILNEISTNLIKIGLIAVMGGIMSGCAIPGKWNAGGFLPSQGNPDKKAHFATHGDNCNGEVKGSFQYSDRYAGKLKAHGEITDTFQCVDFTGTADFELVCAFLAPETHVARFDYRTTNPKHKGDGTSGRGYIVANDNGEGNASADWIRVYFVDGVYEGYGNQGTIGGGNIQTHECEGDEG